MSDYPTIGEMREMVAEADAAAAAEAAAAKQAEKQALIDSLEAKGWQVEELPRGEGFEARKWVQERGCYRVQRGGTFADLEAGIEALEAYLAPRDHD